MNAAYRLGRIAYINSLPLYYELLMEKPEGVHLVSGIPSVVNEAFLRGQTDMSMISALTYLLHRDRMELVPSFCLGSEGAVNSVLLVSKRPIEELDAARIALTHASATSQMVLKILLEQYYRVRPAYLEFREGPAYPWETSFDAVLWIGDEALSFPSFGNHHVYDLGELWRERTGVPIVFAVLVKQRGVSAGIVDDVNGWFERSLDRFHHQGAQVIAYARAQSGLRIDFERYFGSLTYHFNAAGQRALDHYSAHVARMAQPAGRMS